MRDPPLPESRRWDERTAVFWLDYDGVCCEWSDDRVVVNDGYKWVKRDISKANGRLEYKHFDMYIICIWFFYYLRYIFIYSSSVSDTDYLLICYLYIPLYLSRFKHETVHIYVTITLFTQTVSLTLSTVKQCLWHCPSTTIHVSSFNISEHYWSHADNYKNIH